MKYEDLLIELGKHDFKYSNYAHLAIEYPSIRAQLIKNITEDNHINIYYNSYYLVYEASKIYPNLFYEYWDSLLPLLYHKNSYHRSIAHWILTNLIQVDSNNKFDLIKEKYFSMIKDEKFLTGFMSLKDIIIMSDYRKDLTQEIIRLFLNNDLLKDYTEKQIYKMQFEILNFLKEKMNHCSENDDIINYVTNCLNCTNSKNSKLARAILKQ